MFVYCNRENWIHGFPLQLVVIGAEGLVEKDKKLQCYDPVIVVTGETLTHETKHAGQDYAGGTKAQRGKSTAHFSIPTDSVPNGGAIFRHPFVASEFEP